MTEKISKFKEDVFFSSKGFEMARVQDSVGGGEVNCCIISLLRAQLNELHRTI